MNLYSRTFSFLKPFWKQLVTASSSAAMYSLLTGLMLWMIGPLLMTLFQVESGPLFESGPVETQPAPLTLTEPVAPGPIAPEIAQGWIYHLKDALKGWIDQAVQGDSHASTLANFCVLILIVALIKNIFYYIQAYYMVWVQQSVMRSFRDRLFAKYQRLSLAYFHSRRTGQIISRVTNDVAVLNESIDIGFNQFVSDAVLTLVLAISLVILSWELTLMAAVVLPAVFGFIWFIGRKMRKYSERAQRKMADVNSVLEEAISNVRIVKAFSMEDFESKKFFRTTFDYFRALVRMRRIRHLSSPINDLLATIAGIVILYFAGTRIVQGTGALDAGDFITFVLVMFAMIKPVKSLSQIHVKIQEGMAASERIFGVLDAPEDVSEKVNARTLDHFSGSIRYDNVSFSYKGTSEVLSDVSLEVRRGEVIAVVGPSGAGKSTLLDLLPRFYDPQKGAISIDRVDIRDLSLRSLRGLMGIVTQETYLFNDTVHSNIAYGQNGIAPGKVEEAARMANAHEFISALEHGYDTLVGNRGVKLSGGQRQRVAIARALLRNPQILIFDEATSALDTESEAQVQEAIDRLMASRTVLVIAHRLSTVKNADRIIVLDKGRIVESGTHDELMSRDGLYNRLYLMQFRDWG
ncbi:MAG: ABC transporter ATP-binding protein [Candidatus Zixiibacteriota bacterium]